MARLLLIVGVAALVVGMGPSAWAGEALPPLPLSIAVARDAEGAPVVGPCWLERQVAEAKRLSRPHRIRWSVAEVRPLEGPSKLEDAGDRDALAAFVKPKVVNVFVVASLRDIDDPDKLRMGVRWRLRRDLRKDYVIVAASAQPTTLTHELGHFLGNGHSFVVDNVMSYRRDDPKAVRFNAHQGAKMRLVTRRLLAKKKVVPSGDDEADDALAERCEQSQEGGPPSAEQGRAED